VSPVSCLSDSLWYCSSRCCSYYLNSCCSSSVISVCTLGDFIFGWVRGWAFWLSPNTNLNAPLWTKSRPEISSADLLLKIVKMASLADRHMSSVDVQPYRCLFTARLRPLRCRDAPKFGLGRTSAEYSAEGFGSVRFGHASTFARTSVLIGLGFATRSAHFTACVQSLYSKN